MAKGQQNAPHTTYRIVVQGHLDRRWVDWFEGLTLIQQEDGTTLLCGPLADQAALHGVLNGIRDLGLPLVSVNRSSESQQPFEGKENRPDSNHTGEKL